MNHSSDKNRIEFISQPEPVSMADDWFAIANLDHFWIRRRFQVATRLLRGINLKGCAIGEIGCGNGLVQRQFEERFGTPVDGHDLNLISLRQNVSRLSPLRCYNIFERRPEFRQRYDLLLLFDVLEHIEDDDAFLDAALDMLQPDGRLMVNVPALRSLFSAYDRAAGHVRRYSLPELADRLEKHGLVVEQATYWGLSLLPALWIRKRILAGVKPEQVIRRGFSPVNRVVNEGMLLLSKVEPLPQKVAGTSVMALGRRKV
ncbi:MAG: class I SAM-dependent methyltransferase [Verrucomicrobia bacterium]|nr:class I SAM-dependent methyltransferase [Verrucomicrobiota bacterium]MBV9998619.1 class I SAM-dependent methyltransferase [Verrucomicrobiota bacterium]